MTFRITSVSYYATLNTNSDNHVKTLGEVRENGYFTFYEVPIVNGENTANQSYKRAGYYLDEAVTVQRREGHLIPWDEPVRIRSGYLAQAYGAMRMVVINDFSFTPSLDSSGVYDFHPYFSGFYDVSRTYVNDPDDEFLGDAIRLEDDGTLNAGDFTVHGADASDFSELFGMGEVRSASLVQSHIREDGAERRRLREDLSENEEAAYFHGAHEFQLDFRFVEVITDTEEYNRYERDNTLLEMDYVFEYENHNGTLLAVYGFRNHTLYQLENDQWVAM